MAQVVYARAAADGRIRGDLFAGLKFFIAQRCPTRSTYVDKVISNGGEVVRLEKQADLLIADDIAKKTHLNPPGAISYKFIDDSIKRGNLADADHESYRAGPAAGSSRPVGSLRPGKVGRTLFTLEDKICLYDFVKGFEDRGGPVRGNEIYKQLEAINNRHTYQAWRDHYIKHLQGRPHPGTGNSPANVQHNALPTPPVDPHPDPIAAIDDRDLYEAPPTYRPPMRAAQARKQGQDHVPPHRPQDVLKAPGFTADDINDLLFNAEGILDTRVRHEAAAWQAWAERAADDAEEGTDSFTAEEWKMFWQKVVRPLFEEQEDNKRRTKIYNKNWLAWSELNKDGTADEWLDYYDLVVKPLFETEEGDLGATPAKEVGSQISGTRVTSSVNGTTERPDKDGRHVSMKRALPADTIEEDHHQADSPSKRPRKQHPEVVHAPPVIITAQAELEDDVAAMRAFVHISDDDEAQGQGESDRQATPSKSRPRRVNGHNLPSSPPPATVTHTRNAPVAQGTQAIINESQAIDFDIPEPEGGFGSGDLYPDLHNQQILASSQADLGHELSTRAATVMEDADAANYDSEFAMPDPDNLDNFDIVEPESLPMTGYINVPDGYSTSTSAVLALRNDYPPLHERAAMLNIEGLVASGRDGELIQEAAMRSSADPKLFRIVLRSLENGRGVPRRMRGVWTQEDDEVVEGSDARLLQRLEEKHGRRGLHSIEGRLEFLSEWRD